MVNKIKFESVKREPDLLYGTSPLVMGIADVLKAGVGDFHLIEAEGALELWCDGIPVEVFEKASEFEKWVHSNVRLFIKIQNERYHN